MSKTLIIVINLVTIIATAVFLVRAVLGSVGTSMWSLSSGNGLAKHEIIVYVSAVVLVLTIVCAILSHIVSGNTVASWITVLPVAIALVGWLVGSAWIRANQKVQLQRASDSALQQSSQAREDALRMADQIEKEFESLDSAE